MKNEFPSAVPEIPVNDIYPTIEYYVKNLGFTHDWGGEEEGGIVGISRGHCRIFLSGRRFRERYRNAGPVVIWLNLESKEEVDELHDAWVATQAKIVSPPESKPWKLHEFTATDLDGNFLRVFYDFSRDAWPGLAKD
jgi:predicted lactoylglutathione lyase